MRAVYGAISAAAAICEPWVEIWEGDEWGESMRNLLGATHTSYGLSDEDCATVAEILLRNVIELKPDAEEYGFSTPEQEAQARQEATRARDYWLKGGNLGSWGTTAEDAKSVIDTMPDWMFE